MSSRIWHEKRRFWCHEKSFRTGYITEIDSASAAGICKTMKSRSPSAVKTANKRTVIRRELQQCVAFRAMKKLSESILKQLQGTTPGEDPDKSHVPMYHGRCAASNSFPRHKPEHGLAIPPFQIQYIPEPQFSIHWRVSSPTQRLDAFSIVTLRGGGNWFLSSRVPKQEREESALLRAVRRYFP